MFSKVLRVCLVLRYVIEVRIDYGIRRVVSGLTAEPSEPDGASYGTVEPSLC